MVTHKIGFHEEIGIIEMQLSRALGVDRFYCTYQSKNAVLALQMHCHALRDEVVGQHRHANPKVCWGTGSRSTHTKHI